VSDGEQNPLGSDPEGKAGIASASMNSIMLRGASREELDEYARDQFDRIREARKDLEARHQEAEQASVRRQQDLEAQAQRLLARLTDLQERESRLGDASTAAEPGELDSLRRQLHERDFRIELLEAERDAARAEIQHVRAECDLRIQALHKELESLCRESGEALQGLEHRVASVEAERDQALNRLREIATREGGGSADAVDLGAPPPPSKSGVGLLNQFGLQHTDLKIPESSIVISGPATAEQEQIRSERDALQKRVAQLEQDWERHEIEFAESRRMLQVEAERMSAQTQELFLMRRSLDSQAEDQRVRAEDLRKQQIEMRLQVAELRELREIYDGECARERAQLAQERIRIAQLRESLRLAAAAAQEQQQQQQQRPAPNAREDGGSWLT
jgi:hypothetical protein